METQQTDKVEGEPLKLKCTSCGLEKNVGEFHKNPSKKSGRESHCKACVSHRKKTLRDKLKAAEDAKRKYREKTRVYNVNDFMIEESYAEAPTGDLNHLEFLLKSFVLRLGD